MDILNTLDTTKITIPLDDTIRNTILTQDNIKIEKEKDYKDQKSITYHILQKLFKETGEVGILLNALYKKDKLFITTKRTVEVKKGGIDGEVNMHLDTNNFPDNKNRNIIIPWGLGTESYTLILSNFYKHMYNKMNEYMIMHSEIQLEIQLKEFGIIHKKKFFKKTKSHQQFFEREVKNFDNKLFTELFRIFNKKLNKPSEFKEYIQNIIQIQQQSYKSKSRKSNSRIHKKNSASSYTKTISKKKRPNFTENIFNNIIKDAYKRYKINDKDFEILKSEAPNNDGDITALIMSGNDVLHRRMSEKESVSDRWINLFNLQHPTKPTNWRYLLNIYYHTDDLNEYTDDLIEYTDTDDSNE